MKKALNNFFKQVLQVGGSPGLVAMRGPSCSKGRGFESRHSILDGHFFTLICGKICNDVCLKRPKINNKRGRCWPIFYNIKQVLQVNWVSSTRPQVQVDVKAAREKTKAIGQSTDTPRRPPPTLFRSIPWPDRVVLSSHSLKDEKRTKEKDGEDKEREREREREREEQIYCFGASSLG